MNAIIFDLDDTLMVDEVSADSAFLKTCLFAQEHYCMNLPGFLIIIREVCRDFWHQSPARDYCDQVGINSREGLWAKFKGTDRNLKALRKWAPAYRKNSWQTTLQRFSIDDEVFALELAKKYIQCRRELHVVYGDVASNLKRLKEHYRLGILTNGAPDLQWRKIYSGKLGKFFDAILISAEFGVGKPDKRAYEKMLSLLDSTPASTWMIGDSLISDISGAKAVGIKTAWLNRDSVTCNAPVIPDLVIENLNELSAALGL